jgi:hypothetical protein
MMSAMPIDGTFTCPLMAESRLLVRAVVDPTRPLALEAERAHFRGPFQRTRS